MEPPSPPPAKRAMCGRCQRPPRVCYCAALPPTPLPTRRTRVVVLQHAKEQRQRHAISSVPVLTQVLRSPDSVAVVPVSVAAGKSERVAEALGATLRAALDAYVVDDTGVDAVLVLFPHADAKTLDRELAETIDSERHDSTQTDEEVTARDSGEASKHVVLVVVDGTWSEAKKIVHHSQFYWDAVARDRREKRKTFEYVCLDADADAGTADTSSTGEATTKSIYGELRKEPMDGCLSTLEAVALALRVLEPAASGLDHALRSAFRAMVAIQTEFQQQGRAEQRARHGGTPKPTTEATPRLSVDHGKSASRASAAQGVLKPYVFYTTQTDFRKRQRLVQEGDVRVCTRDEAIEICHALNRNRKRGERVSSLPQEAFERQRQRQRQNEEEPNDGRGDA